MWKNNIIDVLYAMESVPNNFSGIKLNEGTIIAVRKL